MESYGHGGGSGSWSFAWMTERYRVETDVGGAFCRWGSALLLHAAEERKCNRRKGGVWSLVSPSVHS